MHHYGRYQRYNGQRDVSFDIGEGVNMWLVEKTVSIPTIYDRGIIKEEIIKILNGLSVELNGVTGKYFSTTHSRKEQGVDHSLELKIILFVQSGHKIECLIFIQP